MYHWMAKIGFEFQPTKQMTGNATEFLRVMYHKSRAYQYLNRSVASIITGPLQSRPCVDVCANASSLLSQAQTLWRRGADQRCLWALLHTIRDKIGKVSLTIPAEGDKGKIQIDVPKQILKLHKMCGGLRLTAVGQQTSGPTNSVVLPRLVRKVYKQPPNMPKTASQMNAALVFGKYRDHMTSEDIGEVAQGIHHKMVAGELDDSTVEEDYTKYANQLRCWIRQVDLNGITDASGYPTDNKLIKYQEYVSNLKLGQFQHVQLEAATEKKLLSARSQSTFELSQGDVIIQLRNVVLGAGFYSVEEAKQIFGSRTYKATAIALIGGHANEKRAAMFGRLLN